MKAEQAKDDGKVELPPAILIRVDAIDEYGRCNDPEGLGRAIFLVLAWLRGENRPLPGDGIPGTGYMFDQMCETARIGVVNCQKRTDSAKKAAAARVAVGRRPKNAEQRRPKGTEQGNPDSTLGSSSAPASELPPQPVPEAPGKPAEVRPKGRGGITRLGDCDCLDVVVGGIVGLGKGGEDFAERVTRDPFAATLEFTKEEESTLTRNVYNFYRRKLGERYDEELMAAYSEAKQGEWDAVLSRGAVFVERLKKLIQKN